jgi:hypothetical protein
MEKIIRKALVGIAVFASLGTVAEINDFWDTAGRKPDEIDSKVSSGVSSAYFETEHERSSEVSAGNDINTFPATGVFLMVR